MAISPELPTPITPDPGELPVEPDEGPITPPPSDPENPLPAEHPKA